MGVKDVYTIKAFSGSTEGVYQCVKMDQDLNPLEVYTINELPAGSMICTCFAGGKPTCRHRQMLRIFQAEEKVGLGWFYNYDSKKWFPPNTQDV